MASNLSLHILGDCDQGKIEEFNFYAGETRILKLQIYDIQDNQKYCLPVGSVLTLSVPSTTGTDIEIANADITVGTDDRSFISMPITAAQTTLMMTGWIKLKIVSGTVTRWAVTESATNKLPLHT